MNHKLLTRREFQRSLALGLAGASFAGLPRLGLSQNLASGYPSKPVRVFISVPPSGTMDVLTRAIANVLRDRFGVILLEHKSGANGNIAMEALKQAEPDGHTLMLGTASMLTINPHAYKEFRIDVFKDFEPIVLATRFETALVGHPSVPANNWAELVAWMKADPVNATIASYGVGTLSHFVLELLERSIGVKINHIPYRGATQGLQDVLGGQVKLFINTVGQTTAPYAAKRLKVFATSGAKRSPFLPDIPSYVELGHPKVVGTGWFSFLAPKGTPKPVLDKIGTAFNFALQSREVRGQLLANGMYPEGGTPQALAKVMHEDYKLWGDLAKAINLQRT
jgi:tripartite-type tricarboxylate transporter receptor subunit TctC